MKPIYTPIDIGLQISDNLSFEKMLVEGYYYKIYIFDIIKKHHLEIDLSKQTYAQKSLFLKKDNFMKDHNDIGILPGFYHIQGSSFLEWFHCMSSNVYEDEVLYHLCIITQELQMDFIGDPFPRQIKIL